ncbi:hypothetical protein SSPSH_000108 [Salinisphaera shabanensis E1L3A]|uniref:Uncharacterized protein n=1 Tax=Salinisphaera shabanensis E1L3A TaxID=1033802 RepID=U2EAT5_9GAMM|nr:hypothetical protein [Salinisphaera shabanensis]ERJ20766.1 hypothetical protein SSPSH_000108 [Salinisphaera shabanensis E1L3A]
MNTAPVEQSGGVTAGYIAAGAIVAALWLGVGILLIPVMAVIALLHWWAAAGQSALVASHHRWLGRHHAISATALVLVLVAPLAALPTLLTSAMTVLNTLAYAPNPVETLAVAWPELGIGTLMLAVFVATAGWILVTLWLSIRLVRRWLRWADRRPA